MFKTPGALSLLAAVALLAACESTPIADPAKQAPVESRKATMPGGPPAGGAGGTAGGAPQSQVASVDLSKGAVGAATAPAQRIVYFDFDSFVIKDEFKPTLDGHAKVLSAQRGKRMVLEGHADERGSREYNLALGQKRAEAVLRSLALLGVTDAQLEAVSFGEERPADIGHDEAAWARNRRVELKDR
jgi:peptidoglycan-associated lipoprotein